MYLFTLKKKLGTPSKRKKFICSTFKQKKKKKKKKSPNKNFELKSKKEKKKKMVTEQAH